MRLNPLGLRNALTSALEAELRDQAHLDFGARVTGLDENAHVQANFGGRGHDMIGLGVLDLGYGDGSIVGDSVSVLFGAAGQGGMAIPGSPFGTRST